MLEKIRFDSHNHTDLIMYQCGIEDCSPGHSWGPAVRDHYLVHYVIDGKGTFQVNGRTYHLEKGHGFLICPGVISYYRADDRNPWSYSWVGFHGLKAEYYLKQANLTAQNPVFKYEGDDFLANYINEMIASNKIPNGREIKLLGLLHLFLYQLVRSNGHIESFERGRQKEHYIKKAIEYIEMNYAGRISITEIARHIGLDRSYFYSIFKQYLNVSPQEYLINFRINKACELMENNYLALGDIARSVGYEDPMLFSRMFKRIKGISPREYRKAYLNS